MNSPILVTGGTGTLGRIVVALLRDAGHSVRVLSRHGPISADGMEYVTCDLTTGEGVETAVRGTQIIVHCAGSAKGDDDKTRTLVLAARQAGVQHLVYISVVGADRVPVRSAVDRMMFGYFGAKLAAEQVVAGSGMPWTTLRATQFQETFLTVAKGMAKLPLIPVPAGFRFQPIAAGEVATRLAELALGQPKGLVPEMGGPRVYDMADLIRSYLRAKRAHRLVVRVPTMGGAARAFKEGANLAPDHAVGRRTWEELLAERLDLHGQPSDAVV